jgi:hypothetical protein
LFPLYVTQRKSIGERADTNLRQGMSPRMEKVYGSFCPDCYATVSVSSNSRSGNRHQAPNYRMFIALLAVFVLLIGGIAVLLLVLR